MLPHRCNANWKVQDRHHMKTWAPVGTHTSSFPCPCHCHEFNRKKSNWFVKLIDARFKSSSLRAQFEAMKCRLKSGSSLSGAEPESKWRHCLVNIPARKATSNLHLHGKCKSLFLCVHHTCFVEFKNKLHQIELLKQLQWWNFLEHSLQECLGFLCPLCCFELILRPPFPFFDNMPEMLIMAVTRNTEGHTHQQPAWTTDDGSKHVGQLSFLPSNLAKNSIQLVPFVSETKIKELLWKKVCHKAKCRKT